MGASLFGTSGIRGIVGEDLTVDLCYRIAQAMGTALAPGARVCVATDTRVSREILKSQVISGILSSGIDVIDLGILPTPALALLTRKLECDSGIMITASHNPPQFNGIKLFNGNSLGYSHSQEAAIERIYTGGEFRSDGWGRLEQGQGMREQYLEFIQGCLAGRKLNCNLKIAVDPGNGAASGFASNIFAKVGLMIIPLNDYPDGLFPGRSPEPGRDTLKGTVEFLREHGADLAVCFDGDADRVVFCDGDGFLGFNEMIAFLSRLAIKETGKKRVATTVETGRLLDLAVQDLGAEVTRGKVGDVDVAYLARELDAAIGVEGVGVYIIPEAGYYPDSIFATLVLLSQLSEVGDIREFFKLIPRLFFEKVRVSCPNKLKEIVMAEIGDRAHLFGADEVNTLDGLRFEFEDSWMLLRASGTEPAIRVLAESISPSRTRVLLTKGSEIVRSHLARLV